MRYDEYMGTPEGQSLSLIKIEQRRASVPGKGGGMVIRERGALWMGEREERRGSHPQAWSRVSHLSV